MFTNWYASPRQVSGLFSQDYYHLQFHMVAIILHNLTGHICGLKVTHERWIPSLPYVNCAWLSD